MDDVGPLLGRGSQGGWFTLEQLVQGLLADVIRADASFQMRQREAWVEIGRSMRPLDRLDHLSAVSLSTGYDRLDYLGLSELNLRLELMERRPPWWRRAWWRVLRIVGRGPGETEQLFRLAPRRRGLRPRITMTVQARRLPDGGWDVDTRRDDPED